MNENDEILRIEGLNVYYETDEGVAKAVNDLDLVVKKGKTVGLVGETGSGKTTTALAILRLVPDPPGVIESGSITLDGMDIFTLTEGEMDMIRGSRVSMIFQDPMTALNPVMTVGDQIAETLRIHEGLGGSAAVRITSDFGIRSWQPVDLPERPLAAPVEDSAIEVTLRPFEIRNFLVRF